MMDHIQESFDTGRQVDAVYAVYSEIVLFLEIYCQIDGPIRMEIKQPKLQFNTQTIMIHIWKTTTDATPKL